MFLFNIKTYDVSLFNLARLLSCGPGYIFYLPFLFYRATAMLSAVYSVVVCLCVCLSVTLRYCIKTAERRITQTTLHYSTMTIFLMPKIMAKFQQMQVGWVKIRHFRRKNAL